MDAARLENLHDATHVTLPIGPIPPLLPWAVGLAIGILIDSRRPIEPWLGVAILSVTAGVLFVRSVRQRAAVPLALVAATCAGAVLHHRVFYEVPSDHVVTFASADKCLARIVGKVASRPRNYSTGYEPFGPWLFGMDQTSFILEADTIETVDGFRPASGRVRVRVREAALAVQAGARVEVFGWLYRPRKPRNPGQFDWALFNARRRIFVNLTCNSAESVRILKRAGDEQATSLGRIREHVRRLLLDDRIESGDKSVSLLDAMVLGRRAGIDRDIERAFVDTGCAHYLAVSGIHVGMLAFAIWFPFRLLGVRKHRLAVLVMAAIVCYAILADPRPSIMRAAVMIGTFCFAILLRKRRSMVGSLSLAAIVILVIDPLSLFDVGFQLSFITVVGIIYLSPPVNRFAEIVIRRVLAHGWWWRTSVSSEIETLLSDAMEKPHWLNRLGRWLLKALCVAVTAWLCSLPIVAIVFGRVVTWGWLNSFVAFPFVVVVMVLGFFKVAVGLAVPILSGFTDVVLSALADLLLAVMFVLESLPGTTVYVPPPPWWLCIIYYLLLAAIVIWRWKWVSHRVVVATFVALVGGLVGWWGSGASSDGVRITLLAVGRGTATVIELPSRRTWLYDAGSSGSSDPGANVIVPCLADRGIRRLDGIILSHPNLDHFGGVPSILNALPCGPVYLSPHFRTLSGPHKPSYALLLDIERRSHPLQIIDCDSSIDMGEGVEAKILWPTSKIPAHLDANDTSIVLRLRYKNQSVLLTGDIGYAAQQWLMEHEDLSADVLLLPHHGAVEGNTAAFIRAVGAKYLVRSSFVRDADSPELMQLAGSIPFYNTAEIGAVEILLDKHGVRVSGFTEPPSPGCR